MANFPGDWSLLRVLGHLVGWGGTTNNALDGLGCIARGHGANEEEEDENSGTEDDELALGRASVAIFSPGTTSLASVLTDLVTTELVVDKTNKGNGVTEELQGRDRGVPQHHRGGNQQNILQDTAQGHHKR